MVMNIVIVRDEMDSIIAEDENADMNSDKQIRIQIYEIQTPVEAEMMIELGVDYIGSVVQFMENWKNPEIRETVRLQRETPVQSSLIPLYSNPDMIFRSADYYEPDIMHFCETLSGPSGIGQTVNELLKIQEGFKKRFPEIHIMRSIPIAVKGKAHQVPTLELAKMFESLSDYFLTDTILLGGTDNDTLEQPEVGFIGITGKTCDWKTAKTLVENSKIPVILAGGISPENVYQGVKEVLPAGVDSCTNTNLADQNGNPIRFKKDPEKVKRLIHAVRMAESEISFYQEEDDKPHV